MLVLRVMAACLVLSLAAAPARARPASATTPEAVAEWIYKEAIKPERGQAGVRGGGFLLDAREMKANFSSAFLDLWKKAHDASDEDKDGPIIGFDPVTNSQDPDFARYRVEVEKRDAAAAVVAASMWTKRGRKPTIVRYDFVLENGVWRIDDIRGAVEKDPWSIRELLTMALKP